MQAISYRHHGNANVLQVTEIAKPTPGPEQILVKVKACALNRADILQRQGHYPIPAGESDILGLELAGKVEEVGSKVTKITHGERVFGLVGSGAYAEYALMDYRLAMPIPQHLNYLEAAAIAEAFLTANEALFTLGELQKKQTVLIHAGASGVGSAAVQLAKLAGATVYFTASQQRKINKILQLGADAGINYNTEDFAEILQQRSKQEGIDVIIDFIGKAYFNKHINLLKQGGRLIQVAFMSGAEVKLNLATLLFKHLQIKGLVMRSRSLNEKREITHRFAQRWLAFFDKKQLQPVIDSVFPLAEVKAAHQRMEQNLNIGKIILKTGDI